jgi:hypothetical protein
MQTVVVLNVAMPSIVILSVVLLSVIILSVVAPNLCFLGYYVVRLNGSPLVKAD